MIATFEEIWGFSCLLAKRAPDEIDNAWELVKGDSTVLLVDDMGIEVRAENVCLGDTLPRLNQHRIRRAVEDCIKIYCIQKNWDNTADYALGSHSSGKMNIFYKHCSLFAGLHTELLKAWVENGVPLLRLGDINEGCLCREQYGRGTE